MAEREELILEIRTELSQAEADVERLQSQLSELEANPTQIALAVDDDASAAIDGVVADVQALDGATAFATIDVDDQGSAAVDEVVAALEEIDGSTTSATIEVDDEATDVAEEALEALEDIEGTYTATIETEGADAASEAVGGIVEGLGEIGGRLGGPGLAALSAKGFFEMAQAAADAVLDVQSLATSTGATLEDVSRLKEAWEQAGGSIDTLERNVIRANEQIRASPGLAAQLGIEISENTSAFDIFTGAVNTLNSGQLDASERLALSMDVFGARGVLVLNDLQTRVGDLDEFMAQVGDNEIITQEQVDQAVEFEQSWDAVGDAMAAIGREILPSVAAAAERIGAVLESWPVERLIGGFEIFGAQVSLIEAALGAADGGELASGLEEIAAQAEAAGLSLEQVTEFAVREDIPFADALQGLIDKQKTLAVVTADAKVELDDQTATLDSVNESLTALQDPLTVLPELWDALIQDAKDGTFEYENAASAVTLLADATGLEVDAVVALVEQEAAATLQAEAAAAEEAAEAQREHAEAIRETLAAFTDYLAEFDPAASRLAGFSASLETMNAQLTELDAAQDTIAFSESLNTLGDAVGALVDSSVDLEGLDLVPDSWEEVRAMPEELAPVVDALSGFRDTMQSEFAQAFEQGGSAEATQWAENTRRVVVEQLRAAGIESEEQINEVVAAMGLLPEQVTTTIEIAEAEQARAVLDDIGGIIESFPPSLQREIALEVIAGDPEAALALVEAELTGKTLAIEVTPKLNAKTFAGDLSTALAADDTEVEFSANTAPMSEQVLSAIDEIPVAVIETEANTAPADSALDLTALEVRTATIGTDADTVPADRAIDGVAAQVRTARVNVETGSVNVPSGPQIAAQIGTVRVQIQGVWSSRIEGSRPR